MGLFAMGARSVENAARSVLCARGVERGVQQERLSAVCTTQATSDATTSEAPRPKGLLLGEGGACTLLWNMVGAVGEHVGPARGCRGTCRARPGLSGNM